MYQEKYILLGKFAPNDWRPIGAIYDELRGMSFTFDSYEEANMALRDLKNLLKTYKKQRKIPLTIRAESFDDGS
jgi:hypothetical protein